MIWKFDEHSSLYCVTRMIPGRCENACVDYQLQNKVLKVLLFITKYLNGLMCVNVNTTNFSNDSSLFDYERLFLHLYRAINMINWRSCSGSVNLDRHNYFCW